MPVPSETKNTVRSGMGLEAGLRARNDRFMIRKNS
jgi:hypothetical protein